MTLHLKEIWNKSHEGVPLDKDVSRYAVDKEKTFPKGGTICDLGGGTGADTFYFLQKGYNVKLIDISDLAMSRALARAKEGGYENNIETSQADLNKGVLPLEDNSVDVVYSRLALHYFNRETTSKLLNEIKRVLKKNGKAFITLKSPEDSAEMDFLRKSATEIESGVFEDEGQLKSRFTLQQLEEMLKESVGGSYEAKLYTEVLGGRTDIVKSGNKQMTLNEITFNK